MSKTGVNATVPDARQVRTWSCEELADYFVNAGTIPNKFSWLKLDVDGEMLLNLDQSHLVQFREVLSVGQIFHISKMITAIKTRPQAGNQAPPVPAGKPKNIYTGSPGPVPAPCDGEDVYEVPNAFQESTVKVTSAINSTISTAKSNTTPWNKGSPSEDESDFTDYDETADNLYEEHIPAAIENEEEYEELNPKARLPELPPVSKPPVQPKPKPNNQVESSSKNKTGFLANLIPYRKKSKGPSPSPEKSFSNRNSTTSESNSADTASVGSCRSSYGEPESQPWFFPIDRDEAELLLAKTGSGTFLVRRSGHGGPTNPYTLSIHYSGQIFHILVRKRPDGLLALGSQKSGESAFSTLTLLVETYMKEKLELQRSSRAVGTTRLIQWPQH